MSNCLMGKTDALREASRTSVDSIVGRLSHCSQEDRIQALLEEMKEVLCVTEVGAVAVAVRNRE